MQKDILQEEQSGKENNKIKIMNWEYKGLKERVEENQRKIKQRLKEIDNKDVMHLEEKAEQWGKTLVDTNFLNNLKDFNFWKEWKNK